jgi:uncharacterized surface protein with fasciclin (FAS1) repeats
MGAQRRVGEAMHRRTFAGLALAAAAVIVAGCETEPEGPTLADVIVSNSGFSTFASALQASGLMATLQQRGPYTVFAPRNNAFAALPPGVFEGLMQPGNEAALAAVLRAHIVEGEFLAAGFLGRTTEVVTLDGTRFSVLGFDGIRLTGAAGGEVRVAQPDVMATNGVIQVIDGILLP